MNTRLAVFILFTSSIGWGFTWLPIKTLNSMGLDSLHLILIAFSSGAILLSPWFFSQYILWKKHIFFIIMIALAGGFANTAFQSALFYGDVIRVMILFYLLPVWSVLGGRLLLNEKIDLLRMITVLLCLSGAFIILDVWHSSWHDIDWIDLLAIASGIGFAATNILFRFTQEIPVMSKVSSIFIGSSLIIAVFLLVFPTSALLPDNSVLLAAVLYGAFWLTLITIGTQWGVTQMEAGRSSIIIVMELVVAVISVALISNAELHFYEVSGGLMVISAALLEGSRNEKQLCS
jgi:drug/metabolite transporter (DMT)-like permease